jgi:hypothetical protein
MIVVAEAAREVEAADMAGDRGRAARKMLVNRNG